NHTLRISTPGNYDIYIRNENIGRQTAPSTLTDWKEPPNLPCEIRISITNMHRALLEKHCDLLTPALLHKDYFYYYVADVYIPSKEVSTFVIENKSDLSILEQLRP